MKMRFLGLFLAISFINFTTLWGMVSQRPSLTFIIGTENPSISSLEAFLNTHGGITPEIINKPIILDFIDSRGSKIQKNYPLLNLAVYDKNQEIADYLISKGADTNSPDCDTNTPLHLAVKTLNPSMVSLLLEGGADVNIENSAGHSPLIQALLNYKLTNQTINWEIIVNLVSDGKGKGKADVLGTTKQGGTLLHAAAAGATPDMIEWLNDLIKKEALKRNLPGEKSFINKENNEKETPLHLAARFGSPENIEKLIGLGANIKAEAHKKSWIWNGTTNKYAENTVSGITPLALAIITHNEIRNNLENIYTLINLNSPQQIVFKTTDETVLFQGDTFTCVENFLGDKQLARKIKYKELIENSSDEPFISREILESSGAGIKQDKFTILLEKQLIKTTEPQDLIKDLFDEAHDQNRTDLMETLMMLSITAGWKIAFDHIIDTKALNLNTSKDMRGFSPLACAIERGRYHMVRKLVEAGVSINGTVPPRQLPKIIFLAPPDKMPLMIPLSLPDFARQMGFAEIASYLESVKDSGVYEMVTNKKKRFIQEFQDKDLSLDIVTKFLQAYPEKLIAKTANGKDIIDSAEEKNRPDILILITQLAAQNPDSSFFQKAINTMKSRVDISTIRDITGQTLLHKAVASGNLENINILLNAMTNHQQLTTLCQPDMQGRNPLLKAIEKEREDMTRILIRKGLPLVILKDGKETALKNFSSVNSPLLKKFLENVSLYRSNGIEATLLETCEKNKELSIEAFKAYLNAWPQELESRINGKDLVDIANSHKRKDIVEDLLIRAAKYGSIDFTKKALQSATQLGISLDNKLGAILIAFTIYEQPTKKDKDSTEEFKAFKKKRLAKIEALLAHGAKANEAIDCVDSEGKKRFWPPIDIAYDLGLEDISELLEKHLFSKKIENIHKNIGLITYINQQLPILVKADNLSELVKTYLKYTESPDNLSKLADLIKNLSWNATGEVRTFLERLTSIVLFQSISDELPNLFTELFPFAANLKLIDINEAKNSDGWTLLHLIAYKGYDDLFAEMLQNRIKTNLNIDKEINDKYHGWQNVSPLVLAIFGNHTKIDVSGNRIIPYNIKDRKSIIEKHNNIVEQLLIEGIDPRNVSFLHNKMLKKYSLSRWVFETSSELDHFGNINGPDEKLKSLFAEYAQKHNEYDTIKKMGIIKFLGQNSTFDLSDLRIYFNKFPEEYRASIIPSSWTFWQTKKPRTLIDVAKENNREDIIAELARRSAAGKNSEDKIFLKELLMFIAEENKAFASDEEEAPSGEKRRKYDLNKMGDQFGLTPLHHASRTGSQEAINQLIMAGADPSQKDNGGFPPLKYALDRKDHAKKYVITSLIQKGAKIDEKITLEGKEISLTEYPTITNTPMSTIKEFKHSQVDMLKNKLTGLKEALKKLRDYLKNLSAGLAKLKKKIVKAI